MGVLDDLLHNAILQEKEKHPDMSVADFDRMASKAFEEVLPEFSKGVLASILGSSEDTLFHNRLQDDTFVKRNIFRWRRGLDLLEILVGVSRETGEAVVAESAKHAEDEEGLKRMAIVRLHARACQLLTEIICLLKNGLADGALGRWRALHETTTIGILLAEHDDELARRFLESRAVSSWQRMRVYQKWCDKLQYEPFSQKEVSLAESAYDDLVKKYGPEYKGDYGWAASAVSCHGKSAKRITFSDIERAVGFDHLKPYYQWACQKVHTCADALFDALGLLGSEQVMLAGQSNAGLCDPAQLAAMSMRDATYTLTSVGNSLDVLVGYHVACMLTDKIDTTFYEIDKQMQEEKSARNRGNGDT